MNLNLWQRALVAIRAIPNPQPVTWENLFPLRSVMAGVSVTESSALDYSPVWAGVSTLARDLAKLPLVLYRNLPNGGKEPFVEHPLYRILHDDANPEMTSYKFRETMQAIVLLYRNAYAEIVRDQLDRPMWMYPIAPDRVVPIREGLTLPNGAFNPRGGRLLYRVTQPSGGQVYILPENMIHLTGMSLDGILGEALAPHAAESFGLGIAAEKFGGSFFGNGSTFGGVVEVPGLLSGPQGEQTKDNIRSMIEAVHQGVERAHKILVLGGGSKFTQRGTAPNEAQFRETREFQVREVARWLGMPPHKLADLADAHHTNIEEENIDYYAGTVSGWAVMWEQELRRKLIRPLEYSQQSIRHVMEGVLRGNSSQRAEFYAKLFGVGAITINRILQLENMNPIGPAGDMHLVPLNMVPIERYNEMITAQIDAKKPQPALPEPKPEPEAEANDRAVKAVEETRSALADMLGALSSKVDTSANDAAHIAAARQAQTEAEMLVATERAAKEKAERDLLELHAVWLTARDDGQAAVAARDQALEQLRNVEAERAADAARHTENIEAERTLTAQAEFDLMEARSTLTGLQAELATAQGQLSQAEQRAAETANTALRESERANASEADKAKAWADAEDAKRQLAEAREAVSAAELARREQEALATTAQARADTAAADVARAVDEAQRAKDDAARAKQETAAAHASLSGAQEAATAAEICQREHAEREAAATAAQARLEADVVEAKRALEDATTARLEAEAAILAHRQAERERMIAVIGAHRSLITDVVQRLLRPEMDRARRRQVTPDNLRKWADAFYQTHRDVCADALYPVVVTHLAWKRSDEDPRTVAERMATEHCEESQRQLRSVMDGSDPEEFHAALERLLLRWEQERPAKLADKVLIDEVTYIRSLS